MNEWQFLSASALAVFPSRWSIFWHYVLRGKKPKYSLEAWVKQPTHIANLSLYLKWVEN